MCNSFLMVREIHGLRIEITAERIERLDLWGVQCRVNGDLFDHRQSDDVLKTMQELLDIVPVEYIESIDPADGAEEPSELSIAGG